MASIITRAFDSYEAFAAYYENSDHRDNVVDIVSNDNAKQPHIDADATFTCKNWQTAVKRLAKATGWDWILAELECSEHSENLHTDCDSVAITQIDDGTWYIAARFYKEAAPTEEQPEQEQTAPKNREEYVEDIAADVLEYARENPDIFADAADLDDIADALNESCWNADSVTGNASGSYTFSAWKAEENIAHNLDMLAEACDEFGQDIGEAIRKGAEYCDVTIRCYLLGEAVALAIDRHGAELLKEVEA